MQTTTFKMNTLLQIKLTFCIYIYLCCVSIRTKTTRRQIILRSSQSCCDIQNEYISANLRPIEFPAVAHNIRMRNAHKIVETLYLHTTVVDARSGQSQNSPLPTFSSNRTPNIKNDKTRIFQFKLCKWAKRHSNNNTTEADRWLFPLSHIKGDICLTEKKTQHVFLFCISHPSSRFPITRISTTKTTLKRLSKQYVYDTVTNTIPERDRETKCMTTPRRSAR